MNEGMRSMADHHPQRGDQVEAWIKDRRDQNTWDGDTRNPAWEALDDLLDEYRLASDTEQSLEIIVNGEPEPDPSIHRRKKKAR